MATQVNIYNLALGHLGSDSDVTTVTERSREAKICNKFYETCRDQVLRDFPWPFASKIEALALVATSPNSEWAYSYAYPTDCLDAQRVLSGIRNDNLDSKIVYKIASGDTGKLIYTDRVDAELEYTFRQLDTSQYSVDFEMALSYRLAFYIAPKLTAGDPFGLGQSALSKYRLEVARAEANAANEGQSDKKAKTALLNARN